MQGYADSTKTHFPRNSIMPAYDLAKIQTAEPMQGFQGKFIHSEFMTFVHWDIEAGAKLPVHSHPHEQVANIISGEFELIIDGETHLLKSGSVAVIPPNAVHSGKSLTKCYIIDVFHPIREDYR